MANTDKPKGLVPVRYISGGTAQANSDYTIASGYNTTIAYGDPVKSTGSGKTIALADAGETMRGVFQGVKYRAADGSIVIKNVWVAGTVATDVEASVFDDPNILFSVQADEDIEAGDIGNTADLVAGTYDSAFGTSSYELDSSSVGKGAGVLIYELEPVASTNGNTYGTNANVLVLINEHELKAAVTGV